MRMANTLLLAGGVLLVIALASAQPPRDEKGKEGSARPSDREGLVARMMTFDKNGDGKLTKEEVTDERMQRLFERADANKDGTVTKEELTALAAQEGAIGNTGRPGGRPGEGRFPGGFGQRPVPGQVMSSFLQEALKLTADQKKQMEELQKDVDGRIEKILTAEQKAQLKEMRERGPGFPGRPGEGFRPGGRPGEGNRPGENRPSRPESEKPARPDDK